MKKPVKDIPILFSGPMVRAILDGDKTETRRLVKAQTYYVNEGPLKRFWNGEEFWDGYKWKPCPYGVKGRRLWVRETWSPAFKRTKSNNGCVYRADQIAPCLDLRPDWKPGGKGWKPAIHMFRWACRTELLNTGVTIERLHDITEAGAAAEGIVEIADRSRRMNGYGAPGTKPEDACKTRRGAYEKLWKKINGKDSWDLNPWVWVIKFERAN